MLNRNPADLTRMTILGSEKIEKIFDSILWVLENVGVKVANKECLELLEGVGAKIEDGDLAKIPADAVKNALASVPKEFILYDRNNEPSITLKSRNIYFGGNPNLLKYLDPYTGKTVTFTSEHTKICARLIDSLPHIKWLNCAPMMADIPEVLKGRVSYSLTLRNTTKVINTATDEFPSFKDSCDLSAALVGGYDKLREKPTIFHYCQPTSPLLHSSDCLKKILYCAEKGIPLLYMPYSMTGGTAPMSFTASLVQCYAEIMSGLVIHQAKCKGAPYIFGAMPSTMDMKTTIATYASPEFHLMVSAAAEIARYFDMPFYGTGGTTDSKSLDYQCIAEATMGIFTSMINGANLIHDLGYMDHGIINSPELLVMNHEIIDMLGVIRNGINFEDHDFCLDVIKEVGPSSHYMEHEHTLENYQKVWYSNLFDHSMVGEIEPLNEKIKRKTINLIENHEPQPLTDDQSRIIDEFEAKWKKDLL